MDMLEHFKQYDPYRLKQLAHGRTGQGRKGYTLTDLLKDNVGLGPGELWTPGDDGGVLGGIMIASKVRL